MLLAILQRSGEVPGLSASTFLVACILGLLLPCAAIAVQIFQLYSWRKQLRNLRQQGLSKSNMADQFDPEYAHAEKATVKGPPRIKALYIHPVKSCGAVEVQRALLTKTGFLYDRCFALATEVSDPDDKQVLQWKFISQRTKPIMSQIRTELWLPDEQSDARDVMVLAGGCLVLSFDDPEVKIRGWAAHMAAKLYHCDVAAVPQVSMVIPLNPPDSSTKKMKRFAIHGRQAEGYDMSYISPIAAALPKLKKYLGIHKSRDLKLMRCTPDTLVRTTLNLAPLVHIGTPSVHGYTDQQPVNINSLSSVHAVSALLPTENQPLDALRFRANLWVTGTPAYEEETWKRCRIAQKTSNASNLGTDIAPVLSVVCRTSRCTMPNVNLSNGVFDTDIPLAEKKKGKPQPSTTLVKHRTVEDGNKSALGYLGMHCVPEDPSLEQLSKLGVGSYVQVGDEIEVLERGSHLYGSTGNDY